MNVVQDEVFSRGYVPSQRIVGGALGDTFGVTSDMASSYYTHAGTGKTMVLQSLTTAWQDAVLRSMQVLTVTVGTAEPLILGTDIPMYRISALLDGGMTVQQVMVDFPTLTADQIVTARDYAQRYPNFGKQYPKRTLKHFLRKGAFRRLKHELAEIEVR